MASLKKHTILECPEKIVVLLARSVSKYPCVGPEDRSMDSKRDESTSLWEACIVTLFHTSVKTQISILILLKIQSESNFGEPGFWPIGETHYIVVRGKVLIETAVRLKHYPPIVEWSSVI